MSLGIEIDGRGLANALRGMADDLDSRALFESMADAVQQDITRHFETQGGYSGERWTALSPGYAVAKQRQRPGRPMLVYDGDLSKSVARMKRTFSPMQVVLTVTDKKAGYHQKGTRKMPARPPIPSPIPRRTEQAVGQAIERHISRLVRQRGLR